MFIAALFIIAKSASNLSVNQQMNRWRKMVYTYSALPRWLIQQGICLQCGRPGFILGLGISLGNENDYASSILAWRITRTEEPGQLQSTGLQRVRHDWVTNTHTYNGILLRHTKKDILPFVATWMDLEGIILSEISQRKTNTVWYHLYMESKKYKQLVYTTKKNQTQMQTMNEWLGMGRNKTGGVIQG